MRVARQRSEENGPGAFFYERHVTVIGDDESFPKISEGRIRVVPRMSFVSMETEAFFMKEENMAKTYYLTTPIYYPSSYLHLGHTYSTVVADTLKRFRTKQGYEVFFTTGTDEHGQKIEQSAKDAGMDTMEYIDGIVASTKKLWDLLDIHYDAFIRTTDPKHEKAVQQIFKTLYDKGEIYKGHYKGKYCTPCESFWTEAQLVDGMCPDCGREVHDAEEESYFFRLSDYQDRLLKLYEDEEHFVMPESRKNEMINNFLKEGLDDLSVSRSTFSWGVPVPFDPKHVIYVWIDALSCYLTALGYGTEDESNFEKFWPADVHLVGKEITRFHTIIWPALLMALDLPLPKMVFGHGWILFDADKMSKSKGNVVYPEPILELYGMDALRYFMLREFSFGSDGNFTKEKFLQRFNSDLANDLGNLLSRTVSMVEKYRDGVITKAEGTEEFDESLKAQALATLPAVEKAMDTLAFSEALEELWKLVRRTNKYIDETMPWAVAKEGPAERLDVILYSLCESLRIIATILEPFMGKTSREIFNQLGLEPTPWEEATAWGVLPDGTTVNKGKALFPRLDVEKEIVRWDEANHKLMEERGLLKEEPEEIDVKNLPEIDFEDFEKLELRIGEIVECKAHPKADRLLVSRVKLGNQMRQIVSGVRPHYEAKDMVGKKVLVVCNLKPIKLRGVESQGMLVAAQDGDHLALLTLEEDKTATIRSGTRVN